MITWLYDRLETLMSLENRQYKFHHMAFTPLPPSLVMSQSLSLSLPVLLIHFLAKVRMQRKSHLLENFYSRYSLISFSLSLSFKIQCPSPARTTRA